MTIAFRELRPAARIYISVVILAGSLAITDSIFRLASDPIGNRWIVLAILTVLTGSFNLKVPSINASLSISEAFVFTAVLLFGTPAGTATVLIECLVITLSMKPQSRASHRLLFNVAAPSAAIWASSTAFFLLSGIAPYSKQFTSLPTLFLPFLGFIAAYFLVNSWLVAIAIALERQQEPFTVWRTNFAWLSVNYFSGAYVAALIVTYTRQVDFAALAIIVPLLIVSYVTFRTAIGRAEDSYKHLAELNRLYLSTIETLAMAIDAKDQITHGHIRRVQTYAVGLAKSIGVSDEKSLKAIEAAALLHDMGKLAVPEHILNKPGKLTPAEFEKMKLHASVGADILSAIDFPYPVVPIVRHHHENWNGTGYPDNIKGTDIPIGARILSVVDCFDALTSDRPYRPRLSDDEAIAILLERRGSMYDPIIVDAFIGVHKQIAPEPLEPPVSPSLKLAKGGLEQDDATAASSAGARSSSKIVAELRRAIATFDVRSTTPEDRFHFIASQLARSVPISIGVLYSYDVASDELVADNIFGESAYLIRDTRIQRGERLSGWVAANRTPIVNSDPALDLFEVAREITPALRASISIPLTHKADLMGVFTIYSSTDFLTSDHKDIVEGIADVFASLIATRTPSATVRV